MEVLQDLINYLNKLKKNISGLKSDAIYYEDESIKLIQENKIYDKMKGRYYFIHINRNQEK